MRPKKWIAELLDDQGRTRAKLEEGPCGLRHVWDASGTDYWGAGLSLQAAIGLATEKSGMDYEALPPVQRQELEIVEGMRNKITGFQGGGFYRHTFIKYQGKLLGTIQYKSQPKRRVNQTLTCALDSCVVGNDLKWLCRMNGLRLVG